MYGRQARYRLYDELTPIALLETLDHKTGWLALGALAFGIVRRVEPQDAAGRLRDLERRLTT
jgi:hypothetical protein